MTITRERQPYDSGFSVIQEGFCAVQNVDQNNPQNHKIRQNKNFEIL